jgi:hypothetical protein
MTHCTGRFSGDKKQFLLAKFHENSHLLHEQQNYPKRIFVITRNCNSRIYSPETVDSQLLQVILLPFWNVCTFASFSKSRISDRVLRDGP